MTENQKQCIDSYEYYKGLTSVYKGMHLLSYALTMIGVIVDPICQYDDSGENFAIIRENIYNQRFD